MLAWLVSKKNHVLSSMHKQGVGGSQLPHLQTHCSHGEWRGASKRLILCMLGFKFETHMQSSKLATLTRPAQPPPPFANTLLAW